MSLLESYTKKKLLNTAINETTKARNSEGKTADSLYKNAYRDYAEVLVGEALRADALYHWGFALLHQAKSKTDKAALALYQEAIAKFSFCLLLKPDYLGAAINGGVAYMDLARLKAVAAQDELYESAKQFFIKANAIQAGSAAYNIACIHGLRNEAEACLTTLELAKNKGFLPDAEDILNDSDLDLVKDQTWFVEFVAVLPKTTVADDAVAEQQETVTALETETIAEPETVIEANTMDSTEAVSETEK